MKVLFALVVFTLFVPVPARAQLTSSDTAALVTALTERFWSRNTLARPEPFLLTAAAPNTPGAVWATRVRAALLARDSTVLVDQPLRLTRRATLSQALIAGDTVRFGTSRSQCREGGPIQHNTWSFWYIFVRSDTGWVALPDRYSLVGDSLQCPW
jgi:hypothetical protein